MADVWDAIIVGAGPAGASAAYFLGEAGLRAVVLERERLPRDKPCGGAISRSALDLFPFDFEPVIETRVSTVRYAWREREVARSVDPAAIALVHRREFDHFLLSQARTEVVDSTRVVEAHVGDGVTARSEGGRTWRGRYLLLAEGSVGSLAHNLGFERRARSVPTLEADVPLDRVPARFHSQAWFQFGALPGGYLWIFPKRDHVSAGIVAFRNPHRPLRRIFQHEMARLGLRLENVEVRGHPLPAYRSQQALHNGPVLLLGDAASLVDPLIGEGIRYALHSGNLAAEVLAEGQPTFEYTRRVHQTLGASLRRAGQIAALFYRLPRQAYEIVTLGETGTRLVTGIFAGQADYVTVSHKLPRLALRYLWSQIRRSSE